MEAQHALLDEAAGLVEAGVLKGTLKENLGPINAANLRRAHQMLENGHVTGKLVLEGWN
jgi:NADPH:quinone reductase-like Zn-dependent oxidoreductase